MVNNTIVGNSAFSGPGGALYLDNSSSALTIANSIIAFNSPGIYRTQGYEPTLLHNCVYGNAAYDYSGMADPTDTNGNISVDPLFAHGPGPGPDGVWGTGDDSDRLRLLSASPCIDAGDNAEVSTDVDLDGQTRIAAGNGNGVAIVDMGAYEYQPVPLPGDMDGDGDVDLLDHELWLGCLRGPSIPYSAGCHVADFDGNGVVDLADSANLFRMLAP
jgi:hypothetical protein